MYRSKDPELRSSVKRTVLKAMRGFEPEEKQEAWNAVFSYLKLDDLQSWAITQHNGIIELGDGPSDAPIIWITDSFMTKEETALSDSIIKSVGFDPTRAYRTVLQKVDDSKEFLLRILVAEINCIDPDVAVYCGSDKEVISALSDLGPMVIPIGELSRMLSDEEDSKAEKQRVWNLLKAV